MGKIGDLWVRLGLKSEDFDKGLKNAEDTAERSGGKLAGVFNKMKGVGVAVYAAIGAAAVKAFNDALENSQKLGDSFKRTTSQMQSAWKTFIASLTSFNWENFGKRMRDSISAAGDLYNVRDRQFEVDNATKLALAASAKERLELEKTARSETATPAERQAAIKALRDILEPIYQNATNQANDLLNATLRDFNAKQGSSYTADQLQKALIAIGTVGDIADIMGRAGTHMEYDDVRSMIGAGGYIATSADKREVNNLTPTEVAKLQALSDQLGVNLQEFAVIYKDMNGDKTIASLVDSFTGFYSAANQLDEEMKRLDILNGNLGAKVSGGTTSKAAEDLTMKISRLEMADLWQTAVPKIEAAAEALNEVNQLQREIIKPEGWDQYINFLQDLADVTEDAAYMIKDAIVDGIGDSFQYLTDALFGLEDLDGKQLMGAIIAPLADACVTIGKAVMATGLASEAFQSSLTNPLAAVAAGAALIAVGSAAKSAISSAIGGATGAYPQTGSESSTEASSAYSGELTIYVTGNIQNDTIAISGQKALNSWNR